MRVIVAGASGAIGRALLPVLLARGHTVAGLVRRAESGNTVASLGAEPIVADALDAHAVMKAVRGFQPEAVIHQLTAIDPCADLRHFDRAFQRTNTLRTRGTDVLLTASREVGATRFIAQSFCGWPYERTGGPVKDEEAPLDPDPPPAFRNTLHAIQHLERSVLEARDIRGTVLRYGALYGPGTQFADGGAVVEALRRRRLPLVGRGTGIWSFVHVEDAATATLAAIEGDVAGVFNVVDDEPASVAEWLPALAAAIGAPKPFRLPAIVARLALPDHLMVMMTSVRGGSNTKFKRTFGWRPKFASWREGFGCV